MMPEGAYLDDLEHTRLLFSVAGSIDKMSLYRFQPYATSEPLEGVSVIGLGAAVDDGGTHKFSLSKWVLLTLGATTIKKSAHPSPHNLANWFVRIVFCLAKSESATTFDTLFSPA